ncbi:hypothetical protein XOO0408 [Xanthomonas oryzae pv. oryzae KACC 10331]|uniref:Uncharacterized protein n=1 Tax=Xanthomonas oryzae pv. oryzae (strain KACC10331 / KXO85) TaxID=291331 RepID=Q5H5V8_XANOR|nr:hypothetical protein XOO0408 [Xanthomonas oryzae pv. oryzae KACC 10331]
MLSAALKQRTAADRLLHVSSGLLLRIAWSLQKTAAAAGHQLSQHMMRLMNRAKHGLRHVHRQLDWSLHAHRRWTLGGMDAAKELTWGTCSLSCDDGRARTQQPSHRSGALQPDLSVSQPAAKARSCALQ